MIWMEAFKIPYYFSDVLLRIAFPRMAKMVKLMSSGPLLHTTMEWGCVLCSFSRPLHLTASIRWHGAHVMRGETVDISPLSRNGSDDMTAREIQGGLEAKQSAFHHWQVKK